MRLATKIRLVELLSEEYATMDRAVIEIESCQEELDNMLNSIVSENKFLYEQKERERQRHLRNPKIRSVYLKIHCLNNGATHKEQQDTFVVLASNIIRDESTLRWIFNQMKGIED